MKRIVFLSLLLLTVSLRVSAIPARNIPMTVLQPDGSELRIIVSGDEFYRMVRTEDGCAVTQGEDGYWYYAAYDINGAKRSSGVRVSPLNGATAAAGAARIIPQARGSEPPPRRAPLPRPARNQSGSSFQESHHHTCTVHGPGLQVRKG